MLCYLNVKLLLHFYTNIGLKQQFETLFHLIHNAFAIEDCDDRVRSYFSDGMKMLGD